MPMWDKSAFPFELIYINLITRIFFFYLIQGDNTQGTNQIKKRTFEQNIFMEKQVSTVLVEFI